MTGVRHHSKPGPGRPFGDWSEGWWWDWFAVQALRAEAESLLASSYRDLPANVFAGPAEQLVETNNVRPVPGE